MYEVALKLLNSQAFQEGIAKNNHCEDDEQVLAVVTKLQASRYKLKFLISEPKHRFCVLKRTISLRWFFNDMVLLNSQNICLN